MEQLLPTVAVLGLAVAFSSPVSVIAVIALIGMPRGLRRAIAFLIGWCAAIVLITAVVVVIPASDFRSKHSVESRTASLVEIAIGLILLVAAYVIHRRPQKPPADGTDYVDPTPAWLVRLVGRHWAIAAAAGGVMLTYSITILAATEVVKSHVSHFDQVAAMGLFAIASLVTIAAPVAYAAFRPERVQAGLERWKRWLARNSRAIGVAVLVVVGIGIIVKAVHDLLA